MLIRILLFYLLITSLDSLAQLEPDSLLPGTNPAHNWVMKDSAVVYTGDELFYLINGGADVYMEYGFDNVVVAGYQNPMANVIKVEIYEMGSPQSAYGIFTLNSLETGKEQDFGDKSLLYDYYLDIWKDKYQIRLTVRRKDTGVIDTLLFIAEQIDQRIGSGGGLPMIQQVIEIEDLNLTHLKYLRGQIALNNVFNFGHGSIAGFQEGITARFGEYAVFVFAYPDEWNRREWFAGTSGKMQMSRIFSEYEQVDDGFTVKDRGGNPFSFKPYRNFILVLRGMGSEAATPYFEELTGRIDMIYPK